MQKCIKTKHNSGKINEAPVTNDAFMNMHDYANMVMPHNPPAIPNFLKALKWAKLASWLRNILAN